MLGLAWLCCKVLILLPVSRGFPLARHGRALQGASFEMQPGEEEAAEAELLGLCCHSAIVSTDVPEGITSCFS